MVITDPIADMLTRIRNAYTAKHDTVSVPASTINAVGMGKSFKFDNATEEGRYLNRRVEFIFN